MPIPTSHLTEMQPGAFALLDCLGFKGIWARYDPGEVVTKLIDLAGVLNDERTQHVAQLELIRSGTFTLNLQLLSDTVAIGIVPAEQFTALGEILNAYSVGLMTLFVSSVIDKFLVTRPHLLLRGCITHGWHLFRNTFIIGPAVDEAAENEKSANGAFVWLSPKAETLYENFLQLTSEAISQERLESSICENSHMDPDRVRLAASVLRKTGGMPPAVVKNYHMPIKGGGFRRSTIVNPFATRGSVDWPAIRRVYETEMQSEREDVQIKSRNTLEFLDRAEALSTAYKSRLQARGVIEEVVRYAKLKD